MRVLLKDAPRRRGGCESDTGPGREDARLGARLEPSDAASIPPHAASPDVVGDGLRRMFDDVLAAPMPRSLVELCDALEDAFGRSRPAGAKRKTDGLS